MNKQLNISVFGLKLTTIDELKRIIERLLPKEYSVNWTNINDATLDILLISHLFYDLPNIVTIRQRPNLKTLKIAHDPLIQSQVIQDTFYLPIEEKALSFWFEQHILGQSSKSHSSLAHLDQVTDQLQQSLPSSQPQPQHHKVDELFKQLQSSPAVDEIQNTPIATPPHTHYPIQENIVLKKPNKAPDFQEEIKKASQQIIEPAFVPTPSVLTGALFYESIHYKYFENLQQKLWNSTDYRQCILIAGDTKIALIDKPNNQFWLANGLTTVGQSSIHIQHADLNNVVRFCHKNKAYDLQYGLWNFVWQNVGTLVPSYTGYYRLKYWPQPLQHKDQKDIFKIAAYLQHGAHLDYIHEHSGIPLTFIYRFIFTGLVSDSIEAITEQQADPRFKRITTSAPIEQPTSALRNFFGKLRKKLGL